MKKRLKKSSEVFILKETKTTLKEHHIQSD